MSALTMNCIINKKHKVNHLLTDTEKKELIEENENKNYSYMCLLREMLQYKHITVNDLLIGWTGVTLFKI